MFFHTAARLSLALSLVAHTGIALAQYGGGYGSSTSSASASSSSATAATTTTSSSSSSIHTVAVGQNGLTYSPNSITAAVGDQVVFQFYPGDHSAAQADFATPCQPMSGGTGFWSGFINSGGGPAATAFTITINNTNPIWFYCAQTGHCSAGMVGVINPPSTGNQTLDMFKSAASNAGGGTAPANVQGGVVGAAPSASSGSNSTKSGSTAAANPSSGASAGSFQVSKGWTSLTVVGLVGGLFAVWMA